MPSLRVGLRRSSEPTIESPQLVKYWGDPTLTEMGRKAEAGDWRSVESFLRGLPTPEQRDIALEGLAYEIEGRPDWLNQWR